MRRTLFVLLSFLVLGWGKTFASSPNEKCDSLFQLIRVTTDAEEKLALQYKLINQLQIISLDSVVKTLDLWIVEYEQESYSKGLAQVMSLKAWYLNFSNEFTQALDIAHKALKIQESIRDSVGMAQTYLRLGMLNMRFERFEACEEYLIKSLELFQIQKDTTRIDASLNNLGVLKSEQNKEIEAIEYFKKSLGIRLRIKSQFWIAYSYYNIGETYGALNNLDSAKWYIYKSVEIFKKAAPNRSIPSMVSQSLAQLHLLLNEPKIGLKHAINGIQSAQKTNNHEALIPATFILGKLQFANGHFEEAYRTQEEYLRLKNDADSVNSASVVAEVEERYTNEKQANEISQLHTLNLSAENKAQRSFLVTLVVIFIALAFGAVIWFVYHRKREQQRITTAEFQTKLVDLKMTALRAQMNPHFIFNCINTAQHFIMTSEKEKAYDYLARFADLLRNVLENSSKTFLPLQDEIDQLRHYIDLEAIRFDNRFDCQIEMDEELEQGIYEIPAMILQPFVENAIVHGLVNKTEPNGHLRIHLDLKDTYVLCVISDNGIGRKAAQLIKEKKSTYYASRATPNVEERLQILNGHSETNLEVEIEDLIEDQKPTGTKVTIRLPFK